MFMDDIPCMQSKFMTVAKLVYGLKWKQFTYSQNILSA